MRAFWTLLFGLFVEFLCGSGCFLRLLGELRNGGGDGETEPGKWPFCLSFIFLFWYFCCSSRDFCGLGDLDCCWCCCCCCCCCCCWAMEAAAIRCAIVGECCWLRGDGAPGKFPMPLGWLAALSAC